MKTLSITAALAGAIAIGATGAAQAWQPTKPIEFVVTSGAGGGTDNFARMIQAIISKHKLIDQPIVVVNKGGGSGAEGYVYGKGVANLGATRAALALAIKMAQDGKARAKAAA